MKRLWLGILAMLTCCALLGCALAEDIAPSQEPLPVETEAPEAADAEAPELVDPEVPELEEFVLGGEEEVFLGAEESAPFADDGPEEAPDDADQQLMAQPLPLYQSADPGVITLYYLLESLVNRIPLPAGAQTSYHIEAAPGATFEVLNTHGLASYDLQPLFVTEEGDVYPQRSSAYANNEADVVVEVTEGESKRQVSFHVLNYCFIYTDAVMNRYLQTEINDAMSDLEKVIQITKIVGRDFDYGTGISGWGNMIAYGCGDCWASTDFICEACARLGIKASGRDARNDSGAGNNHMNALIELPQGSYIAEAGMTETKPRGWFVKSMDGREFYSGYGSWTRPADGQAPNVDVISAELDTARATLNQEESFAVVTGPDAKTLYLYDGAGTLLDQWDSSGCSVIDGQTRIWKPQYTFTGEGAFNLVFRAAAEDGSMGAGAALGVEVYAPKYAVLSAVAGEATPAVGCTFKLTIETEPDAMNVALVDENGRMVYKWFGVNQNLYMMDCGAPYNSVYYTNRKTCYNRLKDGKRVWQVDCSLWELGTHHMTFYATTDDSSLLQAEDYMAMGKTLPFDVTVVPTYIKSIQVTNQPAIGQPICFKVVTPKCTGKLALYDANGVMLDSWGWADQRDGAYVCSAVNGGGTEDTWNVCYTAQGSGDMTFSFSCKPLEDYIGEVPGVTYGDAMSVQVNVADHVHQEVLDPTVQPTCFSQGSMGGTHCSICGVMVEPPLVIPAVDHIVVTDPAVAPTCAEQGWTEGSHCAACGTVFVARQSVERLPHTPVALPAVAPTDVDAGWTEGSKCAVCGEILVPRQSIPALTPGIELAKQKSNGTVTLNVGERRLIIPSFAERYGAKVKSYKSSKRAAASVDRNGLIVAKAEGKAKITVTLKNKKKATVTIKVVDPYKPKRVTLAKAERTTLKVGETLQLFATLSPDTAQSALKWKSSKSKLASVNGEGLVTAKRPGTVKITVTTRNNKKATIKLKIVK